MTPTPKQLLAAWRIWKTEAAAGSPTHQSVTQIATIIAETELEDVPFPAAHWCAACGKWTDHASGTCSTITH